MGFGVVAATVATAAVALLLHLYRLNKIMYAVPGDVLKYSPHRWTDDEIRQTYDKVCKKPIDYDEVIPPKLDRRYIIVGGSGHVGGKIVLQLLQRGQPASTIRILDFVPPSNAALLENDIQFIQTDISDATSTSAAFTAPWPSSIAALPVTVFHTAAVIRPHERSLATWHRTEPVNVSGTRNTLAAAKHAGASVFIFTSSVSVAARPCAFLSTPPWAPHPRNALQLLDERDFDAPLRPQGEFFANYAYSKALSERLIAAANDSSVAGGGLLRTGCLRPGNGIYGMPRDIVLSDYLRRGKNVGLAPQTVQNLVSSWNVSLAHLQLEAVLADPASPAACAGRPFVVTDSGPPPSWREWYRAAEMLSVTPTEVAIVPPLPVYLLSFVVEAWVGLLLRFSWLRKMGLKEPTGDLLFLQPAVFTPMEYIICVDDRARRTVAEGGFGYRGGVTSLEGVCELIRDWNQSQEVMDQGGEKSGQSNSVLETGVVAAKAA